MSTASLAAGRGFAPASRVSPVLSGLYVAVAVFAVGRVALNAIMLNAVMNYSSDEGFILEKLHPSFYGFGAVALFALVAFRIELDAWETRVVRAVLLFLGCIAALMLFAGLRGQGGSAGWMIDSYATACFAALLFLFPREARPAVGKALLVFVLVSAAVATVEFVLKARLLPFTEEESAFRPLGLSVHPLELGLSCAVTIPLVAATDWSRRAKVAACLLLLAGLVVSGARTALLAGGAVSLVLAVAAVRPNRVPQRRLERRLLVIVAALLAVPVMVGALYAAGAFGRFEAGLNDASAQSRVVVYQVFDELSTSDILFGVGLPEVHRIAVEHLHQVAVESALVIFVAIFGAIGTAVFVVALVGLVATLLRGALPAVKLATLLFFGIALSNNGLASKEAFLIPLVFCIVGFRPTGHPLSGASSRGQEVARAGSGSANRPAHRQYSTAP